MLENGWQAAREARRKRIEKIEREREEEERRREEEEKLTFRSRQGSVMGMS